MSALKLETFRPHALEVEDDGFLSPVAAQSLRETAYAEGVKAGAASASAAFEAEKTRLLGPIREALQQAERSQTEAHMAALSSLRPLLDTLIATILPPLAYEGLIAELRMVLLAAATRAPNASFVLQLAPENTAAIGAVLHDTPTNFRITAAPELGPLEAQLHWEDGFEAIDLRQVLNEAHATCARFFARPAADEQTEMITKGKTNAR
ncbi:MAG: hypothetical protein WD046_02565 [Paracoccaceae bacterium]